MDVLQTTWEEEENIVLRCKRELRIETKSQIHFSHPSIETDWSHYKQFVWSSLLFLPIIMSSVCEWTIKEMGPLQSVIARYEESYRRRERSISNKTVQELFLRIRVELIFIHHQSIHRTIDGRAQLGCYLALSSPKKHNTRARDNKPLFLFFPAPETAIPLAPFVSCIAHNNLSKVEK